MKDTPASLATRRIEGVKKGNLAAIAESYVRMLEENKKEGGGKKRISQTLNRC